ncbi:MAG: TonB-dependent receptor [Muribaculaceae bacterium]|nr:TonB-dependent receptor [Muribaculaceae bacterium]
MHRYILAVLLALFSVLLPETAAAQTRTLTGKVIDENNEPLIGATVAVSPTEGTITNLDGLFTLKTDARELTVSYVGFAPQKVKFAPDQTEIIVRLLPDNVMDEVVVVGFGSRKKESVIGAISTLEPEVLTRNQTANISNALVGALPGVIGVQRSGEPGYDSSDFWIRGINTFGANAEPLIIIDGIERSLDALSPEEIESFSVLKDASATAVYGVRGANGAIVIKTKRGQIGAPKVSFKIDYGVSAPLKIAEFVDGAKHMEVINDAARLSGIETMPYSQEQIENTRMGTDRDLYPSVNWLDRVTTDYARNMRVSTDVSGGTSLLRYRFVLGIYNEGGIIESDRSTGYNSSINLTRYNVRSNIDLNITSSTLLTTSIGGFIQDRRAPGCDINTLLGYAMETPPMVHPDVYSNGQFPKLSNRVNPWAMATQEGYKRTYSSQIQSVATLDQDLGALWSPLEGLHVKATFSFDIWHNYNMYRTRSIAYYIASGRDEQGELQTSLVSSGDEFLGFSKSYGGNRATYFELPLSYSRRFGKNNVEGLLLYNMRSYVDEDASGAIYSFPYRHQGLAGRVAYDYDSRYFAEFNFGYNGSENFARKYRYGFFPSAALGWMVSNEKFMEGMAEKITQLRLRASYGLAGNDQIGGGRRFGYLTTLNGNASGHNFGYTNTSWYQGVGEDQFGVPNLTWETAAKSNIGIDLSLMNNSLTLNVDWFTEKRKDIFMQRKTIPELAGFMNAPWANYGKVDNNGVELNMTYVKAFNPNTSLTVMGNMTYAHNTIREYDEAASVVGTTRAHTGNSINANYGLISDGLYKTEDFIDPENGILKPGLPVSSWGSVKPGNIKYRDLNGDGMLTDDDMTAIGMPSVPEIVYGFGFSFRYRRFDISAMFQGVGRTQFLMTGNLFIPGTGQGTLGNILSNVDDRWTEENPSDNVFYPRLSYGANNNDSRPSTWWLKDGNYLRLKNFEVGYSPALGKKISKAVSNMRIYFRATNLLTFSSFRLWDPELVGEGYRQYPLSRIMSVGIDFTFN